MSGRSLRHPLCTTLPTVGRGWAQDGGWVR